MNLISEQLTCFVQSNAFLSFVGHNLSSYSLHNVSLFTSFVGIYNAYFYLLSHIINSSVIKSKIQLPEHNYNKLIKLQDYY